ncbi:hypothetical protein JT359_07555 [Candidatus Poribacteria bacterium]|nr:hypothetical protein [Candidatus Poribacteria bacterium]
MISIINAQEPNNSDKKIEVNSNPNKTDINLIDSALDLDGNESYLEIIDSNSLNNITKEVTVSLWIKPTAYPHEYANILFKGNRRLPGITHRQFTFWLWDDGRISFDTSPAGKFAQFIVPDNIVKLNTWTFIGGVIDVNKDVMKVFINGEEVERRSFRNETHILKTTLPLRIGRSHEEERPCHSPFIGQIDDVSVWNIARSNEEIRSDMISKPTGTENGLIGYWNFDNVENGVIQDLSPNQNHGKMFGNAYLIKYIKPRTRIGIDNITDVSILYEEFLKSEANYYDGYRYLAETYNMLKRNSDAEKVYMRSLNVDLNQNEYTDALINLRKLFIDRGANTEFIKLLEDFKGHMFNSSVYYDLLGDAYLFENMKEMAESSYRNWVELSKDNVNEVNRSKVYNRISEKLLRNNLLPEIALELSEIAVENQIDPSYHITLIKAYIANQLYNEVIQHIKFHRNLFSNKYYEDQIYLEFLTAGRGIDDKDAYIEMLSQLIDEISYPQTLQHKFIFTLAKYYSENDMIEKSNSIIQSTGYIIDSAWMLLGPFDSDNVSGINNIFINEHLPRMDFSSQYDGKYGKVIWKEHALEVVDNIIEMPEVVRRGIYYAYSTINSPEEQDVIFEFAVSDFSKVWVNGLLEFEIQHIEQRNVNNSAFPITLYQGNNSILVKVFEEGRGRGFSLQVTDLNGNTVDNLKILYPNE